MGYYYRIDFKRYEGANRMLETIMLLGTIATLTVLLGLLIIIHRKLTEHFITNSKLKIKRD